MADVLISQVFTGALKATSYTGGSITLDPQNEIIYSEGANINQLQVRTIEPKGPFLDVLVDTDLVFNEFAVKWANGANQSEIYQNGTDLFIESTGNVIINNLPLNNDVSNLSNEVNALQSIVSAKDQDEFYVSANGSDLTGIGSILQPYATIQKAITEAELVCSQTNQCVIYVAPGTYTENLTITKGYLSIIGETSTAIQAGHYGLTGDITINKTDTDDLFQCFVILQGLVIRGSVIDTSTKQHSLTLQDCRIITPISRSYAVQVQQENVDKRVRIINCYIQENSATAFTDALVYVAGGWLYLERCDLTVKSVSPAIHLYKKSYMPRMALTSIEYSNTVPVSAGQGIIWIEQDTLPHESIQSIGESTIVAPNLAPASPKRPAIMLDIGVVPATRVLALYGCIFGITQTTSADEVISNATAIPEIVVLASCFSLPTKASKV